MSYAQHGPATGYYGDGYPDTQAQGYAEYSANPYGYDSTGYAAHNHDGYDTSQPQRPGTAAGHMQPSARHDIASPTPGVGRDPYAHQQQYQEPAAVSGYYGAAQPFNLPSRPGTAPSKPANAQAYPRSEEASDSSMQPNEHHLAHNGNWPPPSELDAGGHAAVDMSVSSPHRPPPSFHKPSAGHRPPPQREDTYYSDPGADAGRSPISPVHPNTSYGAPPPGHAPANVYGRAPPRGPPGPDPRRGPPRDPRRGPPPGGAYNGRNGPRGPPRGMGDPRSDPRSGPRPRDQPPTGKSRGPPAGPNGRDLAPSSGMGPPYSGRTHPSPAPTRLGPNARGPIEISRPSTAPGTESQPPSKPPNGRRLSDALPSHPTPVRPGLMQNSSDSQQSKLPPVRQNGGPSEPQPPRTSKDKRQSLPVTLEELSSLRQEIQRKPADQQLRLRLAKKLVEAARILADEGGRADTRTRNKNRERYVGEAHQILKKLVTEAYPEAQFYMADSLGSGVLGIPNDPKEAFTLYQSAAKAGHAQAAYRTAVCCELGPDEGGGTRKDTLKAFQWYRRAAALGDQPSMYKVGMIQLKGLLGQDVNVGEAVTWLKRAVEFADEQNPHAMHELGSLYDSQAPQRVIEPNDDQALELFTRAANHGFKRSQFRLGQAYEYGMLGCPIDARNSIIWYTRAAAQGEHQSELALSGWYLTGSEGILEHSDTEAYLWARKAALAEPPVAKAMFALGYYTEVGIGCPRSLEEAKKWYSRAAAHRFPKAQERLEELKRGGAKVQKNRENLSRKNQKQQEADCVVM